MWCVSEINSKGQRVQRRDDEKLESNFGCIGSYCYGVCY